MNRMAIAMAGLAIFCCGEGGGARRSDDVGVTRDAGRVDGGDDAGVEEHDGATADDGSIGSDGGAATDGADDDATTGDAGAEVDVGADTGVVDAGDDAGFEDADTPDAGLADSGTVDTGLDTGVPDSPVGRCGPGAPAEWKSGNCGDGVCIATESCADCETDCGACLPAAPALTYHVAANAPGASDGNDGRSPTKGAGAAGPWATVQKAADAARTGDIVIVHEGTYGDTVVRYSGTDGAPIRFVAAPGVTPEVRSFRIDGKSWIVIRGFRIRGPQVYPAGWKDMPDVVIDDSTVGWIDPATDWTAVRSALVRQKYEKYTNLVDVMTNNWSSGIYLVGATHITVQNNEVSHHSVCIQMNNGSTDLLIEGNHVHHCRDGIWSWHDNDGQISVDRAEIRGNLSEQTLVNGIFAYRYARGVVMRHNSARNSGETLIGMMRGAVDNSISDNVAMCGGFYAETMQYPGPSAINVHTSGAGNIVERNFAAFQQDASLRDGNGIIVDFTRYPAQVRNNIVYRNQGSGITITESAGSFVLNNTAVENGVGATDPANGAGLRIFGAASVDSVASSNLLQLNANVGLFLSSAGNLKQEYIDHNIYVSPAGMPIVRVGAPPGGQAFFSIDEIREVSSFEGNGLSGEPGFVMLDPRFSPLPGSPAIDAGSPIHHAADDFTGAPRSGIPDVGAHEAVP